MQVHDPRSAVELTETEVKQNAKAGVLAQGGSEARIGANCAVKENGEQALLAGGTGGKVTTVLKHKQATIVGPALTEGNSKIKAW